MTYVNHIKTSTGKVKAVCECCGRKSKAVLPDSAGEPEHWSMPFGWSCSPFPQGHVHPDGSVGSFYKCPACEKALRKGQTLKVRNYKI